MIIDMFSHIIPERWLAALGKANPKVHADARRLFPAAVDLDIRFRLMERYPNVLEVLTVARPSPTEELVTSQQATELVKIANDELAEIIIKYPNKFAAAVAEINLDDMDAALAETDRAITQLGLKGVQISSSLHDELPGNPKFKPLYEKMAKYDLPIWIHPKLGAGRGTTGLETCPAMESLVDAGVLDEFPNIKFVTHHCGGGIPFFMHRMSLPSGAGRGTTRRVDMLQKFYGDTATIGTAGLMCGYEFFGPDHMVFGSDTPLGATFGQTVDGITEVERMNIPAAEKEKIFVGNARRLLKLAI